MDPVSQVFSRIRAHLERTRAQQLTWAQLQDLMGTSFKVGGPASRAGSQSVGGGAVFWAGQGQDTAGKGGALSLTGSTQQAQPLASSSGGRGRGGGRREGRGEVARAAGAGWHGPHRVAWLGTVRSPAGCGKPAPPWAAPPL